MPCLEQLNKLEDVLYISIDQTSYMENIFTFQNYFQKQTLAQNSKTWLCGLHCQWPNLSGIKKEKFMRNDKHYSLIIVFSLTFPPSQSVQYGVWEIEMISKFQHETREQHFKENLFCTFLDYKETCRKKNNSQS